MNRELRARLLVEEARALGLAVDDLVAAATGGAKPITVAGWIDEIEPAFSPSTAATYGPYWRLAAHLLGDRYIAELTTTDLAGVVDAAAERARAHRPESTGRASRETWIAALRSLCARAVDAGHLITNRPLRSGSHTAQPAGAAPSTTASSPTLPTPSGPPAPTPTSTCCSSASTSRPAPAAKAPSTSVSETSIPFRATVWLREKNDTEREQPVSLSLVALVLQHACDRGGNGAGDAVFRNRRGEPISGRRTTGCSPRPETASAGTTGPRCRLTCFATPLSPASDGSPAIQWRRPSLAMRRPP